MKRLMMIVLLVVFLSSLSAAALADGPRGSQDWNYCPYCGSALNEGEDYMDPGRMYRDRGYGPGMMQRGWDHGPWMMGRDWEGGPGRMYRRWAPGPEEGAECQKYLDETRDMRKQFNDKRFEYSEALRNPQTTGEVLAKLQKELSDLQAEIYGKAPRGCRR